MRKIEYKIVNYEPGFGRRVMGADFGEDFLRVLSEQGQGGWDLKQAIRQSGLPTLLIFGREVA